MSCTLFCRNHVVQSLLWPPQSLQCNSEISLQKISTMMFGNFSVRTPQVLYCISVLFMMIAPSSKPQVLMSITTGFFLIGTSLADMLATLGDSGTQVILQQCLNNATLSDNFHPTPGFGFGKCPQLINCVLSSSDEAAKAGYSAGASIAALIPTMLALIGEFPRSLAGISSVLISTPFQSRRRSFRARPPSLHLPSPWPRNVPLQRRFS